MLIPDVGIHRRRTGATAHHEAGHAVARLLYRVPFEYVALDSDEEPVVRSPDISGADLPPIPPLGVPLDTEWASSVEWGPERQELASRFLVATMAGPAAQMRYEGAPSYLLPAVLERHGGANDCVLLEAYARCMAVFTVGGEDSDRVERALVEAFGAAGMAVQTLLEEEWPSIRRVALHLARTGRLEFDEVRSLVLFGHRWV